MPDKQKIKIKKQKNPPPLPHLLESLEPTLPRVKARVSRSQPGSPTANSICRACVVWDLNDVGIFKKLFNPLKSGHFVSYH